MNLVTAKLIRMETLDGLVEIQPGTAFLGKVYKADMDTMREGTMFNVVKKRYHKKVIIQVLDDKGVSGWFPAEILEFSGGQ